MAPRFRAQVGPLRSAPGEDPSDAMESAKYITDSLIAILNDFKGSSMDVTIAALRPTFSISQVYCPVDTGALKKSGFLEKTGTRENPQVQIGYGYRGHPWYTPIVHERTDLRHKAPTRAKWLQAAVLEDTDNIRTRIAEGYAKVMARNAKRKGKSRG